MNALKKIWGDHSDLVLVALTIGILVILFTPIPSPLLDLLILLNLSFALLLLLLSFYVEKPVQFSTFPSLLLIATLFRLALNIAATRLILSEADAGKVIGAIGTFVVGGNFVIGLIVFFILIIVQYVVVTNGAQRVSEVAARFTLDSMPGQQMSIDADLNMGFIDQAEAQRRRKNIEKEANFYGAMDGASKFVKGDAIAGIVILLINIIGGWAIGVAQHHMKWDSALSTYTLLTIGDGIVTQVPALVIALGTGIIVTRSATDERLSNAVLRQLVLVPKIFILIMVAIFSIALLPGMPIWPAMILVLALSVVAYFSFKNKTADPDKNLEQEHKGTSTDSENVYDLLAIEPIEIRVGHSLINLVNNDDSILIERIASFRKTYALEAGFVIPPVKVRDDKKLSPTAYEITIYGIGVAHGEILPEKILAIHPEGDLKKISGIETRDPTYGLPALWVIEDQRAEARQAGFTLVDPLTVFITHLNEIIRQQSSALLSRAETERLLNAFRKNNAGLVEELIPTVLSLSEIQKILQNLLKEKVSIRNMEIILEVLVDNGRHTKDSEQLTELVRHRLGATICQGLAGKTSELNVLTLDPAVEQKVIEGLRQSDDRPLLILDPGFTEQLLSRLTQQVERMIKGNKKPVLLCSPELRRHLRRLTERVMPQLSIISMAEIPSSFSLQAYGTVTI